MSNLNTATAALVRWAEEMPDREFLLQPVDGDVRVHTFAEALDITRRIAAALHNLGLSPGDKVAILAKNSAEWILSDLAISAAGMISVPIYPTAGVDTISYVIGHSEAKAIFIGKLDEPGVASEAVPSNLVRIGYPYPVLNAQYQWDEPGSVDAAHRDHP